MPLKIAAGNWKMNGLCENLEDIVEIASSDAIDGIEVLICPPATRVRAAVDGANGKLRIGGQDCHGGSFGAHTGDISAPMLADAGASHVIVGHSERRADHGETSIEIANKVTAAWNAGLCAIVCVGETLAQREAGETMQVVLTQLKDSIPDKATASNTVVAYEPVWAIGTGKVATPTQIAEVHTALREALVARFSEGAEFSLLYGGSVKGANAADIFATADVDGALVGGASLKAADFTPILRALAASSTS